MKIKFLRDVTVDAEQWEVRCECCGPERDGWCPVIFQKDDEMDPDEVGYAIRIDQLQFGVDYSIIEYP